LIYGSKEANEAKDMAANYWESTQRRFWQFSKQELADLREKLEVEEENLVKTFPLPQLRHLSIYFNQREHCHPSGHL
jgi:cyclin-C